jgi:hypothetical protein
LNDPFSPMIGLLVGYQQRRRSDLGYFHIDTPRILIAEPLVRQSMSG